MKENQAICKKSTTWQILLRLALLLEHNSLRVGNRDSALWQADSRNPAVDHLPITENLIVFNSLDSNQAGTYYYDFHCFVI